MSLLPYSCTRLLLRHHWDNLAHWYQGFAPETQIPPIMPHFQLRFMSVQTSDVCAQAVPWGWFVPERCKLDLSASSSAIGAAKEQTLPTRLF